LSAPTARLFQAKILFGTIDHFELFYVVREKTHSFLDRERDDSGTHDDGHLNAAVDE
jgi:hypothetical protein